MDFLKGEIMAVDKPYRMSSFGALAHVRYVMSKRLGKKVKIGHLVPLTRLPQVFSFSAQARRQN